MTLRKKQLDYKWVILILCFFMEFICLGFCSSNVGLYTKAVTESLEIKRSVYSLSSSLRYAVQVLVSLNFGFLISKFGTRKLVSFGMIGLTASVFVRGCATQILHIYLGSILWGAGIVLCGGTMASTIVRKWFNKDVGKYTGLIMSANGIGGAIAAQIVTPMINNGEAFGWRNAYFLSAAISLAVSVLVIAFMREQPAGGPMVQAANQKKQVNVMWDGLEYSQIRKRPYFYATAVLVLLTGISLQSIGNITLVYMGDLGIDAGFIGITATAYSLCLTFTKFLMGLTYDKRGLRTMVFMGLFAALGCFVLFALLTNSKLGLVMAMVATVLQTFAIPMETVMVPLLTNDLFGSNSYAKVLGVLYAMNSLGLCLGSPLGDLFFDTFGTYEPCFWFFTVLIVAVLIGYHFVIRAAHRDRDAILAQREAANA